MGPRPQPYSANCSNPNCRSRRAIWIDLIEPTVEEDRKVHEFLGVPVPTRANPDCRAARGALFGGRRALPACALHQRPEDMTGRHRADRARHRAVSPGRNVRFVLAEALQGIGTGPVSGRGGARPDQHRPQPIRARSARQAKASTGSRARSSEPRAIGVSAIKFIPTPSMRSAARTRRSRTCAKALSDYCFF